MTARWIRVALITDVPAGKTRRVDIAGRRILLAHVAGRFYAADDTCTHEDASLSAGFLDGEWVKCPLHGSRFNVRTGAVVDEPAEVPLRTYAVRVEADVVAVDLGEQARP